jgi:hypothetical protein
MVLTYFLDGYNQTSKCPLTPFFIGFAALIVILVTSNCTKSEQDIAEYNVDHQ